MEDNNLNQQKPLRRTTSNKIKDIYETYVKNDKTKNIPISDSESDSIDEQVTENSVNESRVDNSLDDSAFLEMQTRIEFLSSELQQANSNMENLQKENTELKELSLRKTAELENFRKRSIKEKSDLIEYANEKLLASFVEILDDLTAAINSSTSAENTDSVIKGLELIYNKTKKLFDEAGVKQMEFNEDTEFDVHYHEALMMAPSDKPEGTVLQTLQNGYIYRDKVLKHAKVITSSGISNN
ncbi:MAG: nucleotide exchange factor GrpE [Candidatus Kapabacteria bacterium]|nr:nucleotide exchange factor GrpE [Ignavibacteriota bacterium]MCW5884505.1 nucleotide exchange factor GrpE [Candidatus Kapabacteria bacterium]